jgi:hypothetical protein
MIDAGPLPERLIRFCGADCTNCDTYIRFLAGDDSGLVNPETRYRCCWLPASYPRGEDCRIRVCCEEKGILFCGECPGFEECGQMAQFYAQPGYDRLRSRMLEQVARRRWNVECARSNQ